MAFDTLKVVLYPDEGLLQVCEECDLADKTLPKLAKQMAKTMYKNSGCGIAAPQVGVNKRLIVVDCDQDEGRRDPIVLVNPELVETRGRLVTEGEGCLSCPGITVPIARREIAVVRYFDLEGTQWEIEGDGLLGRCLQHEIDHLNGKTLFESADLKTRVQALADYEDALARGAKPGDVE